MLDTPGPALTPAPAPPPTPSPPPPRTGPLGAPAAPSPAPPAVRPALDELRARETDEAVVRFRPGSAGEKAAPGVARAVARARKRLAGLGSEPWGGKPQVCLVDPFPDPDHPGQIVTGGSIVDAGRGEIWMVVTPESPPEAPERPLAVFFGAALPAAADIGPSSRATACTSPRPPTPTPPARARPAALGDADDDDLAAAMAL